MIEGSWDEPNSTFHHSRWTLLDFLYNAVIDVLSKVNISTFLSPPAAQSGTD